MTFEEIEKSIKLLLELAGRQQKLATDMLEGQKMLLRNQETLESNQSRFEQNQRIFEQNQLTLQNDIIALRALIENYIRGIRNGGAASQ